MAEIQNLKRLTDKLRDRAAKARRDWGVKVAVGYTASYAAQVHEDLQAFHPEGQAKFLEQPARELYNTGTLAKIVYGLLRAGRTAGQALLAAGLRLMRESQLLVPVDTGNLRNSAFTRVE